MVGATDRQTILAMVDRLKTDYDECLSRIATIEILDGMPKEWKVPAETLTEKLNQLSDEQWTVAVWQNFMDCLNENIG